MRRPADGYRAKRSSNRQEETRLSGENEKHSMKEGHGEPSRAPPGISLSETGSEKPWEECDGGSLRAGGWPFGFFSSEAIEKELEPRWRSVMRLRPFCSSGGRRGGRRG
jgi:hypothetical protein